MQVYYTTIITIGILIFNLWMAIEGGYLDSCLVILSIIQSFLLGLYIALAIKKRSIRRKHINQKKMATNIEPDKP